MASRGVNKVILIGNLGADPEVRYMPSGDPVTNIRIATSEAWRDKEGNPQERTEWHRVVFFGKVAEIAKQYLQKGSKVYIEGKLRTRKWQGQDGADRWTTEIVVSGMDDRMQMLDSRGGGTAPYDGGQGYSSAPPEGSSGEQGGWGSSPASGQPSQQPPGGYPSGSGGTSAPSPGGGSPAGADAPFDDDIPF